MKLKLYLGNCIPIILSKFVQQCFVVLTTLKACQYIVAHQIMQLVIGIYLCVLRDLQYNRIERLDANFLQLSSLYDLYVYNCLLNLIFCTNSLNLLFLWKVSYS